MFIIITHCPWKLRTKFCTAASDWLRPFPFKFYTGPIWTNKIIWFRFPMSSSCFMLLSIPISPPNRSPKFGKCSLGFAGNCWDTDTQFSHTHTHQRLAKLAISIHIHNKITRIPWNSQSNTWTYTDHIPWYIFRNHPFMDNFSSSNLHWCWNLLQPCLTPECTWRIMSLSG